MSSILLARVAPALGLLLTLAQDEGRPSRESVQAQLDALVERTNALESFVVEYRLEKPGASAQSVRCSYSAPDRFRVEVQGEEHSILVVQAAGVVTMCHDDERFMSSEAMPLPPDLVSSVFQTARQHFPAGRFEDPAELAEFTLLMSVGTGEREGEPALNFQWLYSWPPGARLGWLPMLRGDSFRATAEDELTLTFAGDSESRFVLQSGTGFLERVELPVEQGRKLATLTKLELEPEIDPARFQGPKRENYARDESESFQAGLRLIHYQMLELSLHQGWKRLVEEDKLEASDENRSKLVATLETLHRSLLELHWSSSLRKTLAGVDAFAAWLQTNRSRVGNDGAALAALDAAVENQKAELRKGMESLGNQYRGCKFLPESPLREEFAQADRAAFDAAVDAYIVEPVMKHFDEQIALAREGKLPPPEDK